jgi:hypothetical protein
MGPSLAGDSCQHSELWVRLWAEVHPLVAFLQQEVMEGKESINDIVLGAKIFVTTCSLEAEVFRAIDIPKAYISTFPRDATHLYRNTEPVVFSPMLANETES